MHPTHPIHLDHTRQDTLEHGLEAALPVRGGGCACVRRFLVPAARSPRFNFAAAELGPRTPPPPPHTRHDTTLSRQAHVLPTYAPLAPPSPRLTHVCITHRPTHPCLQGAAPTPGGLPTTRWPDWAGAARAPFRSFSCSIPLVRCVAKVGLCDDDTAKQAKIDMHVPSQAFPLNPNKLIVPTPTPTHNRHGGQAPHDA